MSWCTFVCYLKISKLPYNHSAPFFIIYNVFTLNNIAYSAQSDPLKSQKTIISLNWWPTCLRSSLFS